MRMPYLWHHSTVKNFLYRQLYHGHPLHRQMKELVPTSALENVHDIVRKCPEKYERHQARRDAVKCDAIPRIEVFTYIKFCFDCNGCGRGDHDGEVKQEPSDTCEP